MLPPSLVDLLQQCKVDQLTHDEAIRKIQEHGWSPQFIQESSQWYSQNAPELISSSESHKKFVIKYKKRHLFLSLLLIFLFFVVTLISAVYLVSANKVDIQNQDLKNKIDNFVFRLPLVPKNPGTLLKLATLAHQKNFQNNLDLSFASNDLELLLQGYTDFTDNKSPKFNLSGAIDEEFSLDLKKENQLLFLKFEKVPPSIMSLLNLRSDDLDPLTENWVAFDTSHLETQVGRSLENISNATPMIEELLSDFHQSKDRVNKFSCYKLFLNPNPEQLNHFVKLIIQASSPDRPILYADTSPVNYSEVFRNFNLTVWIDSKDYYLRKIQLSTVLDPSSLTGIVSWSNSLDGSLKPPLKMSLVLELSNFSQELPINIPSEYITHTPSRSSGFTSTGPQTIENGVTAHIETSTVDNANMLTKITFTNFSKSSTKISPLRLRLKGELSGSAPKPAIPILDLKPGESRHFEFTYTYTSLEPVEWIYLNSGSKNIVLGKYQP